MLKLTINNSITEIQGDRIVKKYISELVQYTYDGELYSMVEDNQILTGLLDDLLPKLDEEGYEYEIVDNRRKTLDIDESSPVAQFDNKLLSGITLHGYQVDSIKELMFNKRGIMRVGTGGGKTEIVLGYCMRMIEYYDYSVIFLFTRSSYMDQAIKRFVSRGFLGDPQDLADEYDIDKSENNWFNKLYDKIILDIADDKFPQMGAIGDGYHCQEAKPMMFGLVKSVMNRIKDGSQIGIDLVDQTKIVVLDEAHRFTNDSGYAVVTAFENADRRIALTASPFKTRDDEDFVYSDLLLKGMIGDVIIYIPASWLRKEGYLTDVEVHMLPFRNKPMGFVNNNNWHQVYKRAIVRNQLFHKRVVQDAMAYYKKGGKILILVNEIEHGQNLLKEFHAAKQTFELVSGGNLVQTYNGSDFDVENESVTDVTSRYVEKERFVLIASQIFKEAVDLPSINIIFNCHSYRSTIDGIQIPGRGSRNYEGKSLCLLFDYKHTYSFVLKSQADDRIITYKSEGIKVTEH